MRRPLALAAFLLAATGSAHAAPPSGEQQARFLDLCIATSQNQPLCTCKANAAMSLVDSAFMDVILAAMSGRSLDPQYAAAYNDYIVGSTRACGMGGI